MAWVLQGKQEGKERQFICKRESQEACVDERERILKPSFKKVKGVITPIPSPWIWTGISRQDERKDNGRHRNQ